MSLSIKYLILLSLTSTILLGQEEPTTLPDNEVKFDKLLAINVSPYGDAYTIGFEKKRKNNKFVYAAFKTTINKKSIATDSIEIRDSIFIPTEFVRDGIELGQIGLNISHRKYFSMEYGFLWYYDFGLYYWFYDDSYEKPLTISAHKLGVKFELGFKYLIKEKYTVGMNFDAINTFHKGVFPTIGGTVNFQLGYRIE